MSKRSNQAHRILKAALINYDSGDNAIKMQDYLAIASEMIDQTETYPLNETVLDLKDLDKPTYDYIVKSHVDLKTALSNWRGMIRFFDEQSD